MPRVTIYMSSYNHAQYLRAAVASVLEQSFQDFELFIVDDASTDDSWSIIHEYSDPRIHALRNEVNRNDKAVMRRVITELGRGEYFAVHHSDNLWEPGKLQAQVDFLDTHPGIGAVFSNVLCITEEGSPLTDEDNFSKSIFDQPNRTRHEWLNFFFYNGNALCHPSILICRDCYRVCGTYRDGLSQLPDLDMWVRLCLKFSIHVLPEKLVRFRVPTSHTYISGVRPETRIRNRYEFLKVLENYQQLTSRQEMLAVFPEAARYDTPKGFDSAYALARLALDAPDRMVTRLFGLNILYNLLGDPERSRRIYELYGFTHKDFCALNAANDLFSTERLHPLERELLISREHVHALNTELREIQLSSGWRFLSALRSARDGLFPAGSRRRKFARAAINILTLPFSIKPRGRMARDLALIRNSGLFDPTWYLARYPDVARTGIDPARHYLQHGWLEGRDPGPGFSSERYIADHPEILEKGINPLVYYCASEGKSEGISQD